MWTAPLNREHVTWMSVGKTADNKLVKTPKDPGCMANNAQAHEIGMAARDQCACGQRRQHQHDLPTTDTCAANVEHPHDQLSLVGSRPLRPAPRRCTALIARRVRRPAPILGRAASGHLLFRAQPAAYGDHLAASSPQCPPAASQGLAGSSQDPPSSRPALCSRDKHTARLPAGSRALDEHPHMVVASPNEKLSPM
ncbi:hypothetical protein Dimus_035669 [Dionaea muscipula]